MTDEIDKDEAELQKLFDATAEDASGPLLTRLAARAVDVPAHAKPRWRSLWVWLPGLAVGAGALALAVGTATHTPPGVPPRPSAIALRAAPSATAVAAPQSAQVVEPTADVPALDVVAGLDSDGLGSSADLGVGALDGPPPDADLDAWLYATGELLDNGGT